MIYALVIEFLNIWFCSVPCCFWQCNIIPSFATNKYSLCFTIFYNQNWKYDRPVGEYGKVVNCCCCLFKRSSHWLWVNAIFTQTCRILTKNQWNINYLDIIREVHVVLLLKFNVRIKIFHKFYLHKFKNFGVINS